MEKLKIYRDRWSTSMKEWYKEHIEDLEVTQEIREVNELLGQALDDETNGRQPEYDWGELETERDQKIIEILQKAYGGTWYGGILDDEPGPDNYKNTAGTYSAQLVYE